MVTLDEATLLAYVDGELPADVEREVEAALANDASARAIVDRLRTTPESMRAVFDATLTRPLPTRFAELILRRDLGKAIAQPLRPVPVIATAALIFALGLVSGFFGGEWRHARTLADRDDWVHAVVDYQVLYGRETLNTPDATAQAMRQTEARLSRQLAQTVAVPDLMAFGLHFKRGQVLDFHGVPIAQLAYLPTEGKPLAYCVIGNSGDDQPPAYGRAKDLNFVHWRQAGKGHILVGSLTELRLRNIAAFLRGESLPAG